LSLIDIDTTVPWSVCVSVMISFAYHSPKVTPRSCYNLAFVSLSLPPWILP